MKHSETMGPYRLADCIGHGGMAMVYRAQRQGTPGLRRQAVVKVLLPHLSADHTFVKMFSDEARLSAQLNHPNIVRVDEFGVSQGTPWIAMEYLEGRNLQQIYSGLEAKQKRLPLGLSLLIAREMCNALSYAHDFIDEEGNQRIVVHRDVSPSNVMVCTDGTVKLLDFGVARVSSGDHTQTFRGKFAYMAPEQLERHPIDPRSDVFAAGVILHELLTGQRLFAAHCDAAVLVRLQQFRIPRPSDIVPTIPRDLDDVVMKALARDPQARYADASELCDVLAAFDHLTKDTKALLNFLDHELPETWHAEWPVAALPTIVEALKTDRRSWMLGASALMFSMLPGAPGTRIEDWELSRAAVVMTAPAAPAPAVKVTAPTPQPAPIAVATVEPAAAEPAAAAPAAPAPVAPAPVALAVSAPEPVVSKPAPEPAVSKPMPAPKPAPIAARARPVFSPVAVVRKKFVAVRKSAPEPRRNNGPGSLASARKLGFVDPFSD